MTSGTFSIILIFCLIIAIIILSFHDYIRGQRINTAKLNSMLDSYKKELAQNDKSRFTQHVNYLNLESAYSDQEKELSNAKEQIAILQSQLLQHPAALHIPTSKVEIADRDSLLNMLGEKSKEISLLRAEVAPLHQQIDQLKHKINSMEDCSQHLNYLRSLYPNIDEILEARASSVAESPGYNYSRSYLSQQEWNELTDSQRDQLALDRYVKSHNKTKWQIGRDYELYVAHVYRQQGYDVDPCGSYLKLEDMGRDLILTKGDQIRIVQCKYWSSSKEIHERFIFLLYGSVVSYCIENNIPQSLVKGIFVTNIKLSPMAKQCAAVLGIAVKELFQMGDFPRIKCNVKKDSDGEYVYIYHLPMDPQYDRVKIKDERECYAYTVQEAESYGFRRAN